MANPPYIATAEIATLAREVSDFDPVAALDGGADGLAAYRTIGADARRLLAPGGFLVLEVGAGQSDAVSALASTAGLAAIDAYAQSKKGATFAQLSAPDRDAVLTDVEKNVATGFVPNAAAFFNLVRAHTIQGTFCDPYYGGNANFVGWDLIGFPGLRMAVGEDEQRMAAPKSVRKSAYEDAMFTMKGGGHGHRP